MASEAGPSGDSRPTSPSWREREIEIATFAERQHGNVTISQLLGAGLSRSSVGDRVRSGRYHRVYPGTFSLGRPPRSSNEHRMAAVLACGPSAALSHAAAAAHLGIRPSAAVSIDVTTTTGAGRGLAGIRAHRSKTVVVEDIVIVERIPTTSCARTLLDLAETIHPEALAKALDQAEILRLFDLADLQRVLARNPGRRGLLPLQACLSSFDPQSRRTKNDFEFRLFHLLREADLPIPEVNATLYLENRRVEPDFLWRRERFVVETDGWATHRTRQAFERDRAKDALMLRGGYRAARITWRQLRDEPEIVLATVRAGLAQAAA